MCSASSYARIKSALTSPCVRIIDRPRLRTLATAPDSVATFQRADNRECARRYTAGRPRQWGQGPTDSIRRVVRGHACFRQRRCAVGQRRFHFRVEIIAVIQSGNIARPHCTFVSVGLHYAQTRCVLDQSAALSQPTGSTPWNGHNARLECRLLLGL